MRPAILTVTLPAVALALQGCEIQRDSEEGPSPAEKATASPVPAQTPTATPSASIIRPDAISQPLVDLPPEPLEETIGFPEGGYELDEEALNVLRKALESEPLDEGWPITLWGHTDSAGSDRANLRASVRRAEAVAEWFIDQGVDEERITVIPLGEQRPIAPNALLDGTPHEAGRAANRRVEIWIGPEGSSPSGGTLGESGETPEQEAESDEET